jgi:membrane dipeptidase
VDAALSVASRAIGMPLMARAERKRNGLLGPGRRAVSRQAVDLHGSLRVVDLHADSLLWGRDLLARSRRGHVDVPRLIDGRVVLQALAASTKVPRRANLDRNDDRTDDVLLLALAQAWPRSTYRSLLARALHLAERARALAERSGGRFAVIETMGDLEAHLVRHARDPAATAGLLTVEGAHALDGDPANVDILARAGFRMMSPAHFFDTAFGGSAHGVEKGGLTSLGREMVARMESRSMLLDVSHASIATIDDALGIAKRPIVASHTGVTGTCDSVRNLSDDHLRGIAGTGGLIGIGFWPMATCGTDPAGIARAIEHAMSVVGPGPVALGSDFDGGVPTPFDAGRLVELTDALLAIGMADGDVRRVMGENAIDLLLRTLPPGDSAAATTP